MAHSGDEAQGRRDGAILIACGGTGGHLFPGIAVAEKFAARGQATRLLISEKQIDAIASEGYQNLTFIRQPSVAMPSVISPKFPRFLLSCWRNYRASLKLCRDERVVAVLGMGGFTSAAPLMAGKRLKLPTFIHESNAVPGRANRLNARFARIILVGFEDCASHFPGKSIEVVGTPLRNDVMNLPSREEGISHFGLSPEARTVFVMGGSQGAKGLNERIVAALPKLAEAQIQVVHSTGPQEYEAVSGAYRDFAPKAHVAPFMNDVQFAYAAADLVVARSGASSLAEIACHRLPTVLVPYPFAADDHQTRNAEIFARAGAAVLWQERDVPVESFGGKLVDLLSDVDRLSAMSLAMGAFSPRASADRICDSILSELN